MRRFKRLISAIRTRFQSSTASSRDESQDLLLRLLELRVARLEAALAQGSTGDGELFRPETEIQATEIPGTVERPALAVFTPLPPERTGIADYAAELASALTRHFDVTYVISDAAPEPTLASFPSPIVRLTQWKADRQRDLATPRLYQIGNSRFHTYQWLELRERAGMVVLHDYSLHYLAESLSEGDASNAEFIRLARSEHGAFGEELARLASAKHYSPALRWQFTFNAPVLRQATGVIVHSRDLQDQLKRDYPELPVHRVPMLFADAPESDHPRGRSEARRQLGIAEHHFVVVAVGRVAEPKRLDMTIQALSHLGPLSRPWEFWIVGPQASGFSLDQLIEACGVAGKIHFTGHVDMGRLYQFLKAADCAVNLRYPVGGETSATLIRALGQGVPTIVFNHGSFGELPDDVVLKLPYDPTQTIALEQVLKRLVVEPDLGRRMGAAARSYILEHHSTERVASQYARFIRSQLLERV